MLVHPDFDPVAFSLGPLQVRWYGLMYLIGFLTGWALGRYRAKQPGSGWNAAQYRARRLAERRFRQR